MSEDLEASAAEAVSWMRARSTAVQAEVYLSRTRSRSLARRDGGRDGLETARSLGAGVRVVSEGRVGFASAAAADAETLRGLWSLAVEQLPHAEAEPRRRLPAPEADAPDAAFDSSLWDESLFSRPWEELDARLGEAESAASCGGRARVLRSELEETRGEIVIANTLGLLARERGGSASVSVSSAAESGDESQVGEGFRESRRFDALDPSAAGAEAARRALASIGARRTRPGRRAVVFEPWVAVEFIELLADLLSAEEVQGGRSLLAGRLGRKIASPLVTLRDDPRRPGGPASARFDDEGVPTRDKTLVEGGVLRAFLHDSATAAREGAPSNGCGYRDGWSGLPGPGPSNLFLAPGILSRDALIGGTKDGLLVLEVLGTHMIDPVSGEFSVGVSGLEIERGALARPFKGAMISGGLLDLLARVDAVADDLAFHGSFASPTLRVSALDVA
ncbi:MAG TPA: metallopeptidase TldD-related protein [Elusimicrobiota bacterium]|jgi:PmbA protein|nr:metallopeptidase TldD-related protein [Elusimicrobiota bacterium]